MKLGNNCSHIRKFVFPSIQFQTNYFRSTLHSAAKLNYQPFRTTKATNTTSESDDDVQRLLNIELRQRVDPEYLAKTAKRLDVVWELSSRKARKPGICACCGGSGQENCSFCRGSGALTLGEHVFCSLQKGCKHCPVCKSKGSVKCVHCSGTGYRASWMEEPNCFVDCDRDKRQK